MPLSRKQSAGKTGRGASPRGAANFGRVTQFVEYPLDVRKVVGANPAAPTNLTGRSHRVISK
jgi:hypothetical protein